MLTYSEIFSGLSAHLDPDVLLDFSATFTCGADFRVRDVHRFVCIEVADDFSVWVPLYSHHGPGRQRLPKSGRTGCLAWRAGIYYWHLAQRWIASHAGVIAAAEAANERTRPGNRDRLSAASVAKMLAVSSRSAA